VTVSRDVVFSAKAQTVEPHPLTDLSVLDTFSTGHDALAGDPCRRLFYSPVDDLHGALTYVLASAQRSLVVAMFGFDDQDLADILKEKLEDPSIYVQLTLDSSQAAGVHEKAILAAEGYPNSSIAIGRSEKGAIMHLKTAVVDAACVVHGSTNWSAGGEDLQDNELQVLLDPREAAIVTTRIAAIHTHMLATAKA